MKEFKTGPPCQSDSLLIQGMVLHLAQGTELGCASGSSRVVWNTCAIDSSSTKIGTSLSPTEHSMFRALLQQQEGLPSKGSCTCKPLVN